MDLPYSDLLCVCDYLYTIKVDLGHYFTFSTTSDVIYAYSGEKRSELQDILWHESKQRYHLSLQLTNFFNFESSKCASPSAHVLYAIVPQI